MSNGRPIYPAFDPNCVPGGAPVSRDPRDYLSNERPGPRAPRPAPDKESPRSIPPQMVVDRTKTVQIGSDGLSAKLLYAMLLCNGDHPYTSIATTFNGERIGVVDRYVEFWKNNLGRVVVLRVAMDLGAAGLLGARAKLSLGTELADQNKIDELYGSGTLNSQWILLKPEQTLWINTGDTNFTLNNTVFRGLLFDPISVFGQDLIP